MTQRKDPSELMSLAIELAVANVREGGGPFGAVVAKDGQIVATGVNRVTATNDPTAHAEVVAIRAACAALGSFQLEGCELYASCEPCPMCLGAIYWARPATLYYAASGDDAAAAGFDDRLIHEELRRPVEARRLRTIRLSHPQSGAPFAQWSAQDERTDY